MRYKHIVAEFLKTMTDGDVHRLAQKLYEAHQHNLGQAGAAWEALDKSVRSHWRFVAKVALAEIARLTGIKV